MIITWKVVSIDKVQGQLAVEYSCEGLPPVTLNLRAMNPDIEFVIRHAAPRKHFQDLINPPKPVCLDQYVGAVGELPLDGALDHVGLKSKPVGMHYRFDTGAILPEHVHATKDSLHDVLVTKGRVELHRTGRAIVIMRKADRVDIKINEPHWIKALEPSETLHTLLHP